MKRGKMISSVLATLGIIMISIGFSISSDNVEVVAKDKESQTEKRQIDIESMAATSNTVVTAEEAKVESTELIAMDMEVAPASVIIPPRIEVYDGLTIDELAAKLNRNLGTGYIAGKGYLIASQCIEKGVDPYIAVAIMLHETGCKYNCSSLVRTCNNVGGQKGAPGCNGGSYKRYATLDEGIIGFIDNLYRNYFAQGRTTIESIAPKYAASSAWPSKIRSYVAQIRAS